MKPALQRLRDGYSAKARELGDQLLSLQEQADSVRELLAEREEENRNAEAQVCVWGGRGPEGCWQAQCVGCGAAMRPHQARPAQQGAHLCAAAEALWATLGWAGMRATTRTSCIGRSAGQSPAADAGA